VLLPCSYLHKGISLNFFFIATSIILEPKHFNKERELEQMSSRPNDNQVKEDAEHGAQA